MRSLKFDLGDSTHAAGPDNGFVSLENKNSVMNQKKCGVRWHALIAVVATACVAAGCMQSADLSAVQAERAKSVARFDTFQSAASNGKVMAAGTAGGAIVTSADGGKNWTRQTLPELSSVIAMTACADGSLAGLDFYHKLWVSGATGARWEPKSFDKKFNAVSITCDGANRLWLVGAHTTIMSSADKGASWTTVTLGEDAMFTSVQFTDAQRGIATGEFGTVATTVDGGATWQKGPAIPGDYYPYATWFADAQHGWSTGLGGVLLRTEDGGKKWQPMDNPAGTPLYALVPQGDALYAVGAGGAVIVLRDGRWTRFDHGVAIAAYLTSGAALNPQTMLVAGAAGALHVLALPGKLASTVTN